MSTFGLIGKSLSHSFSKDFFQKKFQSEGLLHTYENFEFQDLNLFASFLKGDFAGLNITIPYKEAVIPFLDELSEEAKKIGAVNTIVFKNLKQKNFHFKLNCFQEFKIC